MFGAGAIKEFIPAGAVVKTEEQFPDLDALADEPKKGGKKGKKGKKGGNVDAPKPKVVEDPVDETLPWKGKPSSFFTMDQDAE